MKTKNKLRLGFFYLATCVYNKLHKEGIKLGYIKKTLVISIKPAGGQPRYCLTGGSLARRAFFGSFLLRLTKMNKPHVLKKIVKLIGDIRLGRFVQLIRYTMLLALFCILGCSAPNPEEAKEQPSPESKAKEVLIEYLAHASFRLHHEGHTLLLDPFADSVWIGYKFPRDITADAIFSTHPHYDHDGGIFRELNPYWEGKIPFYQDPGEHTIGSFKMEGIKGRHCDPYGKEFGQKNTIWIFEVAGLRIAHWGDNAPMNDTIAEALSNIDILMVPIDDTYHILKEEELKEVLKVVNAPLVIPMHYKIETLEKRPGLPKNLETIENYMKDRKNVIYLDGNEYAISKNSLPKESQYLVFQHSPLIKVP